VVTKEEALKLALEALSDFDYEKRLTAITAIKETLAQPAQEPVGYVRPEVIDLLNRGVRCAGERLSPRADKEDGLTMAFYTTPPQRPWVGLTREESLWILDNCRTPETYLSMIEAKLKEKNTP
jgi:hypothetical protein